MSSPKEKHFFPQIQVKAKNKKKVFARNGTHFSPISGEDRKWNTSFPRHQWTPALRCTPESNYWGDADVAIHTNHWRGYSQIIKGDISPPLSAPLFKTVYTLVYFKSIIFLEIMLAFCLKKMPKLIKYSRSNL